MSDEASALPPEDAPTADATPSPADVGSASAADPPVADAGRRRFFRDFAGEMIQTAASVVGAASVLQRSSLAAATALLDPEGTADAIATSAGGVGTDRPTGFRTAFRFVTDEQLVIVDQRRIPEALVEYEVRSAGHAAYALRQLVVAGGPAGAQIAAIGLALSAHAVRDASPSMVRANLKAAASAIKAARPTLRSVTVAVDRLTARYEELAAASASAADVASALRVEADRIVEEATTDNGRIADAAAAALPVMDGATLRVLTHGSTGPLSSGQFGTALGALQVLHHAERQLHVWVAESRPTFIGSRVTAWELSQAGVPHAVVIDGACGQLIASGDVDAVLVGAERVAANGDVIAPIGTYPLALAAARRGVPFIVCAPLSAFDEGSATGEDVAPELRPERELVGPYVAAIPATMVVGTSVRNASFDLVPADLVTVLVTEEGAMAAPFGPALTAAAAARAARWSARWTPTTTLTPTTTPAASAAV